MVNSKMVIIFATAVHFCICVSANTSQTICVQELDSASETINLKVSLTDWLEQLITLDFNNGLMNRLLVSLTLLYKKVEVLENGVMGLIPTPVQIYQTIEQQTAQLQAALSSLEHQLTILHRRYRWEFVFNISIMQISIFKFKNIVRCVALTLPSLTCLAPLKSLITLYINICKITFFLPLNMHIHMIAYLYASCATRINLDKQIR